MCSLENLTQILLQNKRFLKWAFYYPYSSSYDVENKTKNVKSLCLPNIHFLYWVSHVSLKQQAPPFMWRSVHEMKQTFNRQASSYSSASRNSCPGPHYSHGKTGPECLVSGLGWHSPSGSETVDERCLVPSLPLSLINFLKLWSIFFTYIAVTKKIKWENIKYSKLLKSINW